MSLCINWMQTANIVHNRPTAVASVPGKEHATCPKCGKPMQERDRDYYCLKDDLLVDKKTGSEVSWIDRYSPLQYLSEERRATVIKYFEALYIDGYANLETNTHIAVVYVFDHTLHIVIVRQDGPIHLNVPYESIKLLNVTEEREITALRTWLVGPMFAALFKQESKLLNIGFTGELGLLEIPSFKMTKTDIDTCYRLISEKIRATHESGAERK